MPTSSTPSLRLAFLPVLAIVGLMAVAPPLHAQDRFGAAATVTPDGDVFVLKPGSAVGPAAAMVFRREADGSWTRVAGLPKLPGAFPGEGLVEALTSGGDLVVLASGDPEGRDAGHLYRRDGDRWLPQRRVPMDPTEASDVEGLPASGLDMPTLMAIMGPPPRTLALSPEGALLAVAGGSLPEGTVHVLREEGDRWELETALKANPDGGGPIGSLAIREGLLVVGAPRQGTGGAVHIFETTGGEWSRLETVVSDSTEAAGLLGAAVALSDSRREAFASAPGRDRVVRLTAGSDGSWSRTEELAPPDNAGSTPTAFGAALAVSGDRLLVGAPGADGARGRAYVYQQDASAWTLARTLTPDGLDQAAFGSAVAVGGVIAVVGAPNAWGADGRAAVFDLAGDGGPVWLQAGESLRAVAGAEPVSCAEGEAAGFSCEGVDLVSFLPLAALGADPGERVSDIWGWSDPDTGREYVLVGRTAGLAFVDITEPGVPRLVGLMPANPSGARDIKVYSDHAFMTGDGAGDHGLLIFDLTRLRGAVGAPATFEPDARYGRVASVHNLVIDTESGFAYTVGTNTGGQSCGGGLHMIDIRDPLQPAFAGCYTDSEGLIWTGRTHDAQCTVYRGPDENYQGRQICFAANETAMRIVDVTDKSAPRPISTASHPGTAYVHQGWLTEDHRYLYVNDELDEIVGTTDRTRTLIYDVSELDDPILVATHLGPDAATDHNLYIAGNRAYLANYQAGFRVLDITDPESPQEIGWFDTTPYGENPPGFGGGAWTAWPFFDSGMVVVSSINEGLFIVRPQRPVM
ncbi:MAG: choice-of-anchor B family protein [Gemmatimonadetes bacterium]|nr:choice-of-anchor B family protein [Gemmatimonadota bacterium]